MSKALADVLISVKKLLPKQGPLEFFVHHNTLHEFENLPFKEGLLKGQNLYQGHVLKSMTDYQGDLKSGKINSNILKQEILHFLNKNKLNENLLPFCLDLLNLKENEKTTSCELSPQLSELKISLRSKNKFYVNIYNELFKINFDDILSPLIFRFLSLYFDHGISYWTMPNRSNGLLETFKIFYGTTHILSSKWEKSLARLIKKTKEKTSEEKIQYLLDELSIDPQFYSEYLFDLSYRYKGWGGLVISFEKHPEWNKNPEIKSSFNDFITILLLCETAFIQSLFKKRRKKIEDLIPLKSEYPNYSFDYLFQAGELLRKNQSQLNPADAFTLVKLLTDFERKFLFHKAFEESFYSQFLSSFTHAQKNIEKSTVLPRFQIMTCIDDREESFRRYIEEDRNDIETFGVAGHFGLDIKFKGIFNAHQRALCPDIVTPSKQVSERLIGGEKAQKIYKLWARLLWSQNHGSKTLVRGFIFQFILGLTSLFSLTLHILFPFLTSRIGEKVKSKINKSIKTNLNYRNDQDEGFSLDDMVRYARNLLKTIGLTDRFASAIVILGHGSHSLNNPHESAYNCGACGGGKGAPNARLICHILNDGDVRIALAKENITIPDQTIFLPGFHNTCSNEITFFDITDRNDIKEIMVHLQDSAKKDAKERCRRFPDVDLNIKAHEAFNHCLGRANNYMEARPEYNHATNALCIVGPRYMNKQIFLDRRAFLVSYDESKDNENSEVLKNILSAIGPVCSGINLEYYFSYMDNEVYGCGSKLPHNVTSLLGVMNGYQSDLRMGLSQQMIEIHDPYRLMLLVVAKPNQVLKLLNEIKSFSNLSDNQWIHLCVYDPTDQNLYRYCDEAMVKQDFSIAPKKTYSSNFSAFKNSRQSCAIGNLQEIH